VTAATTGRRGFLAALGALTAAGALPRAAAAEPVRSSAPFDVYRAAWRAAYLEVLEQLAETLRAGFESGELYAFRDAPGRGDDRGRWRVEDACSRYFGLGTNGDWEAAAAGTARMLLVASPRADVTGDGGDVHPCDHAGEAVAWDVIVIARERGWYTPTPGEAPDPLLDHEAYGEDRA
jgi:hypothetical protein